MNFISLVKSSSRFGNVPYFLLPLCYFRLDRTQWFTAVELRPLEVSIIGALFYRMLLIAVSPYRIPIRCILVKPRVIVRIVAVLSIISIHLDKGHLA